VRNVEAVMPNSRTNKVDKTSGVQWIKTKAGRHLHQCDGVHDGVQLSLEAVWRQRADINRKCVSQAHCTWKEGMTECQSINQSAIF